MGLLVVLAVLVAGCGIVALYIHALRAHRDEDAHGWLAVVPLIIIFGWGLIQLLIG